MNEDDVFKQLAEDKDIAAALAEHEQSCSMQQQECLACRFFNSFVIIRQFVDLVDAAKVIELVRDPSAFVIDAQAIIQFLSEASRYFMENLDWEIEEGEEGDLDE